jgi:hypothetical protein
LLHDIQAQHARQPILGLPALAGVVGIERRDLGFQQRPRGQLVNLIEEEIAPCQLFIAGVFRFGKGFLYLGNSYRGLQQIVPKSAERDE